METHNYYYIPSIGKIPVTVNPAVKPFFSLLQKSGELERLMKLDHLGCLKAVFPGVKHTRFDYIALMLYLSNLMKLEGTSRKRTLSGVKLSGMDVLQMLILCSNIGHTPGTFSVEKGILKYLHETGDRLNFMGVFETLSESDKEDLKAEVLDTGDYTKFNRILAILKLDQWIKYSNLCKPDERLLYAARDILLKTLIYKKQSGNDIKLIYYFNIIRKISYLTLDCLYLPIPLRVNLEDFIKHLVSLKSEKASRVEDFSTNNVSNLIHDYERAAYEKIYHSRKARVIVAITVDEIVRKLEKHGINLAFEWLYKDAISDLGIDLDEILNRARSYKIVTTVHSGAAGAFDFFVVDQCLSNNILDLEGAIKKGASSDGTLPSVLFVANQESEDYSYSGEFILDLLSPGLETDNLVKEILNLLHVFYKNMDELGTQSIFEQLFCQLLEYKIEESFGDRVKVTVRKHSDDFWKAVEHIFITPSLLPGRKSDWVKNEYFPSIPIEDLTRREKDQYHEHMATWGLIKILRRRIYWRKGGYSKKIKARLFLVIPASIEISKLGNGRSLAEFDGAILEVKTRSRKGILYLVEAKRVAMAKRENVSSRGLEKKFRKLKLSVPEIRPIKKYGAFTKWLLN